MKNERMFLGSFLFALAMLVSQPAAAGPASPEPRALVQPDGTGITVFQRGDERMNWVETQDGYTIVKDPATGWWEYAVKDEGGKLAPTGVRALPGAAPPEGTEPHLKPEPVKRPMRGREREYVPGCRTIV